MFQTHAPAHWKAGLPVIPLEGKKPIPTAWSAYKDTMPELNMQNFWLSRHPDANMGLPLGPQSGVIGIDLDTDDPRALMVLEQVLPQSPWKRVGKKGFMLAYRFSGQRTARIKTSDGKMLVEILSAGTQFVLPPSIHPETKQPYTANCSLIDALGALPELPVDIEMVLRKAFIEAGFELSTHGSTKISEWVAAGARDSSMISHAGILSRAITRGERSLQSALDEISHWAKTYVEQVAGDPIDPQKGRDKVLEFLVKDVAAGKVLPRDWDEDLPEALKLEMHRSFGGSEADVVEWDQDQLKSYIQGEFEKHAEGSAGRQTAVTATLKRMSKATTLAVTSKDAVLRYIAKLDRSSFSTGAMRKMLADMEKGPVEGNNHTEIAEHLLESLKRTGEVRHHGEKFWQWSGACWVKMEDAEIMRILMKEYGNLPACRRFNDVGQVMRAAATLAKKCLEDVSVNGINFANGFLTSDLRLLPHDSKYGCTYVLPYRYMQNAECQRFQQFLMDCWGHNEDFEEKKQALREAIAVTLFGMGPKFQRVICLIGVANSGKSTLKDIVMGLVPAEACSFVPPHDWNERWNPSMMFAKLVNFCGELSETQKIAGEKFKSVVCGEQIVGEYKGLPLFSFKPACTHWFATNHAPKTNDYSDGFTRRWLFLTFDRPVDGSQRVIGLAEDILSDEREGILAWAAPAISDALARNGYTLPKSHDVEAHLLAGAANNVWAFLCSNMVVRGSNVSAPGSELFPQYMAFCTDNWLKPVDGIQFRARMRDLARHFQIEVAPGPVGDVLYRGIKLAK